jgi:putative transposase
LAKSVHDAGWAAFVNMRRYKCERYGRAFIKISRFEPTTRRCHACGHVDGSKPLDIREWDCPACGAHLDRDINAAINVKDAAGRAAYACGAPARPRPSAVAGRGEAGSQGIQAGARAA